MQWIYQKHGLRTEPSGAIAVAAALTGKIALDGEGDIALVVSGRNVDDERFRQWTEAI
jgi:threo-3-hydroxy-L-aspartate ammonia-lyase